jgi:hypothetical protein
MQVKSGKHPTAMAAEQTETFAETSVFPRSVFDFKSE